jgi:membrane protein YqaA with SNARE-associated domain
MLSPSTAQLDARANWLTRRPGIALAFVWGFAEGTLFFILPDVPLSLAAMHRPRRALFHVAAIVAGAVLAGAVMFSWSSQGSSARGWSAQGWSARTPTARQVVARVPFVTPAMFERAESDYRQFGIWAASWGPVRGIPYKVYAVEAPEHSSLWPFLLVTIPARLWRLLVVWLGFAGTGMLLRKLSRASLAPALHALFWIVVYAIYWATVK